MTDNDRVFWGGRWTTWTERRREWQTEWDAMTPTEQVVFEMLPYSAIPELSEAREIVAHVAEQTLRDAAAAWVNHTGGGVAFLFERADQHKREADGA